MNIVDSDAVFAIDVEPAFMPGGSLPVVDGDAVVEPGCAFMRRFRPARRFASREAHPPGHVSYASAYRDLPPFSTVLTFDMVRDWTPDHLSDTAAFTLYQLRYYLYRAWEQRLWPDHAPVESAESQLHPLVAKTAYWVENKGMHPVRDSYSAWRDALNQPTGLGERAHVMGIKRCFFLGLAFDYCVAHTAIDAAADGFEVYIVEDLTRAVDASPAALTSLRHRLTTLGVGVIRSEDIQ